MKNSVIRFFQSWFPSIIVGILVGFFSLAPSSSLPISWETSDTIKHFLAYFILSGVMVFPAIRQWGTTTLNRIIWITVVCTLFGALLEVGQSFSPGRDPSVHDAITNLIGSAVGQIITNLVVWVKT